MHIRKGSCPINYNILFSVGEDRKIEEIKKNNENKNISILNQLYASELEDATIFDINKLILLHHSYAHHDNIMENFFLLNKKENNPKIYKKDFFLDNKLINGEIPEWFDYTHINLYFSKYPGNLLEYPLNRIFIFIFQKLYRTILKVLIIICYIYFTIFFSFISNSDYNFPIKRKIINIFFQFLYLALIILNIIFLKAKYNLSRLLYFYEKNIFKSGKISGKGGLSTFIFQIIIEVVPQIIIFILFTCNNIMFIKDDYWFKTSYYYI